MTFGDTTDLLASAIFSLSQRLSTHVVPQQVSYAPEAVCKLPADAAYPSLTASGPSCGAMTDQTRAKQQIR
jgi:hypothetical protein